MEDHCSKKMVRRMGIMEMHFDMEEKMAFREKSVLGQVLE